MELTVDHNNLVKSLNEFKNDFNKSAGAKEGISSLESFFLKNSQVRNPNRDEPNTLAGEWGPYKTVDNQRPQDTQARGQQSQGDNPSRGNQLGSKPEREQYRPSSKSDGTSDILKGLIGAGTDKAQGGISDLFANQTLTDNKQIRCVG